MDCNGYHCRYSIKTFTSWIILTCEIKYKTNSVTYLQSNANKKEKKKDEYYTMNNFDLN